MNYLLVASPDHGLGHLVLDVGPLPGLLEGREGERLVALSPAGQLRLAFANGHVRSAPDALLAEQTLQGYKRVT